MRSVYGKDCAKHPEFAGRRYLPNNNCIGCHRESMKEQSQRRKADMIARDERLALLEIEVASLRNAKAGIAPEIPALRAELVSSKALSLSHELNLTRANRYIERLEALLEASGK
jgi:hypothetical protein